MQRGVNDASKDGEVKTALQRSLLLTLLPKATTGVSDQFIQYEMHLGAVVTVTPACLDSLGAARLLPQMYRCWFHLCVFLRVMRPNGMTGLWLHTAGWFSLPDAAGSF